MNEEIRSLLLKDKARFQAKGLFGNPDDSLSMRIPGRQEFLLALAQTDDISIEAFDASGDQAAALHAAIYRNRPDTGAILAGKTPWSAALAKLGEAIPTLFDEPARHIGKVGMPIKAGNSSALLNSLAGGTNIAIYGDQRICLGFTPDRIVFNSELFEKCAKAFVIARATGQRIRKVPGLVCYIAGGRLRKDQKRSAESYAAGRIPEGMNAY